MRFDMFTMIVEQNVACASQLTRIVNIHRWEENGGSFVDELHIKYYVWSKKALRILGA
jgi:hypothetical protein